MTERIFAMAHYADMSVLYLLIALSLLSVYLIVEKLFFLRQMTKQSKLTLKNIETALVEGNFKVIEEISMNKTSLDGKAARMGLSHIEKHGSEGLDQIFSAFYQIERPKLERSLGFLATVGSNAPYIGLFGTVLGIMKSFNDMAHTGAGGQGSVMAGISAALVATAAGLMVAIPSVLAYNYFQKQVKSIFGCLDAVKDMIYSYNQEKKGTYGRKTV